MNSSIVSLEDAVTDDPRIIHSLPSLLPPLKLTGIHQILEKRNTSCEAAPQRFHPARKEVLKVKNRAVEREIEAEKLFCRALDSPFFLEGFLWQQTISAAIQAKQAWSHLVKKCNEDTSADESLQLRKILLAEAQEKIQFWEKAILRTQNSQYKSWNMMLSSKPQLTKEDLKSFPFAELLDSTKYTDKKTGFQIHIKLIKTIDYPYIRIREERNFFGLLIKRKELIANELIVTLENEDIDPNKFLQGLQERLGRKDIEIVRDLKSEPTYKLSFPCEINLLPAVF